MSGQILLAAAACVFGAPLFPLTVWPLAFGLGTVLATVNLWQIARVAHWTVGQRYSGFLALVCFGAFVFRFAGTGLVLYLLLVRAGMPLVPLVAGLSSLVVWLSIMRFSRNAGHTC